MHSVAKNRRAQSEIKITRTVVSPDVAWLPQVATLSTEVVIVASASSVLVGGVRRSTCGGEGVKINTKAVADKHISTISIKKKKKYSDRTYHHSPSVVDEAARSPSDPEDLEEETACWEKANL